MVALPTAIPGTAVAVELGKGRRDFAIGIVALSTTCAYAFARMRFQAKRRC